MRSDALVLLDCIDSHPTQFRKLINAWTRRIFRNRPEEHLSFFPRRLPGGLTTRSSDFVWIWDKRVEDKRIEIVTSLDELTQCSPGSTERIEFLK